MAETVFKKASGGDWVEASTHADQEEALAAGKALLLSDKSVERVRVAGEVFARGPGGIVIEVMSD